MLEVAAIRPKQRSMRHRLFFINVVDHVSLHVLVNLGRVDSHVEDKREDDPHLWEL